MRKIYIILITIMSILIIFLIGILGFYIYSGENIMLFRPIERKESNIRKDERFINENIETLEINLVSADIYVYSTDDNDIRVVQYAKKELKQNELYQAKIIDKKLIIKDNKLKSGFVFFNHYETIYELYIPKSYNNSINIKTVSGDILIENSINNSFITLESTSGDIKNTSTMEAETNIKTVSGDIDFKNIIGNVIIKTTSGEIKANNIEGTTFIHNVSGDIHIYSLIGSIDFESTSGNVKIEHFELKNDSKIKTVSGDIYLTLQNTNCELRTKTISGDVNLPNGSSLIGERPEKIFELKTTSGDIMVK